MENKKISIIIPVYNVEEYLRQSMDSVVNQTYKNLEIICVNDGSPDNSLEILKEYEAKDNRIVLIDKKNEGVAAARNDAMKIATGDYMMFVDGDDWIELNACERLVGVMSEYEPDVVMYSYYREYADKTLPKTDIFPEDFIVFEDEECRQLHRRHAGAIKNELAHPENFDAICSLCTKLFRTNIIKEHQEIYYIDNKIIGTYGDGLMNLFYYKYVHKAVFIGDHLYHYRKTNEHSIVTAYKKDFPKRWNNMFSIIGDYIENNHLDDDFKEGLNNRIAVSIVGLGLNELSNKTNVMTQYNNVKKILHSDWYRKGIEKLDYTIMPFHWKILFGAAKHNFDFLVFALLKSIKFLKSKI